ncbi:unnamed protein product [Polarella glacialis]|uniref:Tyrosine-protein kinase ephrin type A/B receptor-like domain-containing protein n=1 Tax=Polarella glacialis TaxID=89957 RepID=A0A813EBR1_POLGL|nr:unnamed protein product [Polarella glacialis]
MVNVLLVCTTILDTRAFFPLWLRSSRLLQPYITAAKLYRLALRLKVRLFYLNMESASIIQDMLAVMQQIKDLKLSLIAAFLPKMREDFQKSFYGLTVAGTQWFFVKEADRYENPGMLIAGAKSSGDAIGLAMMQARVIELAAYSPRQMDPATWDRGIMLPPDFLQNLNAMISDAVDLAAWSCFRRFVKAGYALGVALVEIGSRVQASGSALPGQLEDQAEDLRRLVGGITYQDELVGFVKNKCLKPGNASNLTNASNPAACQWSPVVELPHLMCLSGQSYPGGGQFQDLKALGWSRCHSVISSYLVLHIDPFTGLSTAASFAVLDGASGPLWMGNTTDLPSDFIPDSCGKRHVVNETSDDAECVECPKKGTGNPMDRSNRCSLDMPEDCNEGQFWNDTEEILECQFCPLGRSSAVLAMAKCALCLPGEIASIRGMVNCTSCQPGAIAATGGLSSCEPCGLGRYTVGTDRRECFKCSTGLTTERTMSSGDDLCVCAAGFYNATSDQPTTCGPCAAGLYKDTPGKDQCQNCPEGRYSGAASMNCSECPEGTFTNAAGSSQCQACSGWLTFMWSVPNASNTACDANWSYVLACLLVLCSLFVMSWLLPYLLFLPVPILDMRFTAEGVVITTVMRHNILLAGKMGVEVWLQQKTQCAAYRVKVLSLSRLLLCDLKGDPVTPQQSEASHGTVNLRFPRRLVSHGACCVPFLFYFALAFNTSAVMASWSGMAVTSFFVELLLAVLAAAVGHAIRWRLAGDTPLARKLEQHREHLRKENPRPKKCPIGPSRAITIGQVLDLFESFVSFVGERNMYYVCPNIVLPLTKPMKLSYAELAGPRPVEWFVSHFWGMLFQDSVSSLRKHAEMVSGKSASRCGGLHSRNSSSAQQRVSKLDKTFKSGTGSLETASWKETSYWICTFSNNQWELMHELGSSWEQSSFYLALRSPGCKGTAMIFDELAMPLTRSWCLFELLQTFQLTGTREAGFTGLLLCTRSGVMNFGACSMDTAISIGVRLSSLRLQDASASSDKDKRMIDELVQQQPGGFDAVNAFVQKSIRDILLNMRSGFLSDLDSLDTSLSSAIQKHELFIGASSASSTAYDASELPTAQETSEPEQMSSQRSEAML